MNNNIAFFGLILIIIIGGFFLLSSKKVVSNEALDSFAQCISDSGAKFYGAFWCSHCKAQKEDFGNSDKLPYIECSTADGQGQLEICQKEGIEGYPTWKFANGKSLGGELSFNQLSEQTGCSVPN
ncbi:hypothetical protein C0584_01955 [Candidatus Parcubacteria bacterium]|nr:MAG: hypothetical protein C0584_01955 [Candidatus Parcubacteria bacterium]